MVNCSMMRCRQQAAHLQLLRKKTNFLSNIKFYHGCNCFLTGFSVKQGWFGCTVNRYNVCCFAQGVFAVVSKHFCSWISSNPTRSEISRISNLKMGFPNSCKMFQKRVPLCAVKGIIINRINGFTPDCTLFKLTNKLPFVNCESLQLCNQRQ